MTYRRPAHPILAANAHTFGQAIGILQTAMELRHPVAIQVFPTLLKDPSGHALACAILALRDRHARSFVTVHLDHGLDFETCAEAVGLGFDSVMIDGSYQDDARTPRSYQENFELTRRVVDYAHARDVKVEGALGLVGALHNCLGRAEDTALSSGPFPREAFLTDVEQASRFVRGTGVDALAIAIGTVHGLNKFDAQPTARDFELDRISQLRAALPGTLLVLHGSSSLPAGVQEEVNRFGGQLPKGWGIPPSVIAEAVRRGIGKVNVDTDFRLAMTAGVRRFLAEKPEEINPAAIEQAGVRRVKDACAELIGMLQGLMTPAGSR